MDLFSKRMKNVMQYGSLGAKLTEDSNVLENRFFDTDQNYQKGILYDWDMNELEEVEFKFEKVKTYSAEGLSVEYMIHFRPDYNPESKFKDKYYRNDGRERLGFYVDVYDRSKKVFEKWLIVGKDDRVAFDRYNAFKCDWCFEWVSDGQYYNTVGCVRSAQDGSVNDLAKDDLEGSRVNDELSIFMPSNQSVSTIALGTRFVISDNIKNPWVYEVIRIKDTTPLGTTKVYLKQGLYHPHKDFCGIISEETNDEFYFDLPIDDLPSDYGGQYHMICDCIRSKGLPSETVSEDVSWELRSNEKYIYVNGQTAVIKAISSEGTTDSPQWHIFVDDIEYSIKELRNYFTISFANDNSEMSITATNKNMVKYIVKVAIYDEAESYYDSVEMEVRI